MLATVMPLHRLVESLRRDGQRARAAGLEACARLARLRVPVRGLMLANEPDGALDRLGGRYFGVRRARRALRDALNAVSSVDQREAIESALSEVLVGREDTYYCLGLAVGLTAGETHRPESHPRTRPRQTRRSKQRPTPRNPQDLFS